MTKNVKNSVKEIAAELQKIKNANWECVGPQLPGISNTFYTCSTLFFIISTCNIYRGIDGILFLANYRKILELQM